MQIFSYILATVSPSEELPDVWLEFAITAFYVACLLALVVLTRSFFTRRRSKWFFPTTIFATIFGSAAWLYFAYVYRIDYVAVEMDGTKASSPFWQAMAIPNLPILVSLVALVIYQMRPTRK